MKALITAVFFLFSFQTRAAVDLTPEERCTGLALAWVSQAGGGPMFSGGPGGKMVFSENLDKALRRQQETFFKGLKNTKKKEDVAPTLKKLFVRASKILQGEPKGKSFLKDCAPVMDRIGKNAKKKIKIKKPLTNALKNFPENDQMRLII